MKNNDAWELKVASFAKRRNWKYGKFAEITISSKKNTFPTFQDFYVFSPILLQNIKDIDSIKIELRDHKDSQDSPFPDFMDVSGYPAVSKEVIIFLDENRIQYISKPVDIVGNDEEYYLVAFPDTVTINHHASNTEFKNNVLVTKGREKYIFSESRDLVSLNSLNELSGIARVKEKPTMMVCDNLTKEKLTREKFTGIDFKPLVAV